MMVHTVALVSERFNKQRALVLALPPPAQLPHFATFVILKHQNLNIKSVSVFMFSLHYKFCVS